MTNYPGPEQWNAENEEAFDAIADERLESFGRRELSRTLCSGRPYGEPERIVVSLLRRESGDCLVITDWENRRQTVVSGEGFGAKLEVLDTTDAAFPARASNSQPRPARRTESR